MEGNKSNSRALMVFGAPCSGKTTFAEKFAKKFGLAYYDLNQIKEDNKFTFNNILTILSLVAKTGQTIIIEGCMNTEKDRTKIRNVFHEHNYTPSLIWVQTDVATIRARLKMRYKSVAKAKEVYESEVDKIEAPTELEKPIILSGKHTFETQSKHVITGLAENL